MDEFCKSKTALQQFHVLSTNEYANKYLFNDKIQDHPKLQWLMLCASGLGQGKQFHQWIPQIKESVSQLKENATKQNIVEFYTKVYPNTDRQTIEDVSNLFVDQQNKKVYLANQFLDLKIDDIETLSQLVSDKDIKEHERNSGNY